MADLYLHDHPVSPFACKIRILLREKSLPFDKGRPDGMGMGRGVPAIAAANPREEIPVLEDRKANIIVFDSTIIAQYIEDKWPTPNIMPEAAEDKARARMIEEISDTSYEAINWGYGETDMRAEGDLMEALLKTIASQLEVIYNWFEAQLGQQAYFNGNTFGWADMCVAPVVNRSVFWRIGPADGTKLSKWFARVKERPSVKLTLQEMTELAEKQGPAMKKAFLEQGNRRQYRDHRLEWIVKSGALPLLQKGIEDRNIRFGWPDTKTE